MSPRKYLAAIMVCLFILSQNLLSQITLQGVVRNNGAEPVQNALVEVIDQEDAGRGFSSTTNADGQYFITITGTGISEGSTHNPGAFQLLQNYPNPFNPSTVIGYEIPYPSYVRIEIFNVLGQKIKTLLDCFQSAPVGRVVWDATNDQNHGVSAGVYIYSLIADGVRINRKMLLLDGHLGGVAISSSTGKAGQSGLHKTLSNNYLLRVTGMDIEPYTQNLLITGNMEHDMTVIRTVTDYDGNVYRTLKIGNQWWMAKNLQVSHYSNGDVIPNITDNTEWSNLTSGALCVNSNDENLLATYGRLYNWFAVNDDRVIAPAGWHVPTDEEWRQLEMFLGMSRDEADAIYWRGTDEGGKLKEMGTSHWSSPNAGATNESGFTALPGGSRYANGGYDMAGNFACFWTATGGITNYATSRLICNDSVKIYLGSYEKQFGFSVRCVCDGSIPNVPKQATPLNGAIGVSIIPTLSWSAPGGADTYGLQVSTSPDFTDMIFEQSGIVITSHLLTGLADGVTYYWHLNASNSAGTTAWSDTWSFTTAAFIKGTVTDIDGNVYQTIKIGEQWWMAENMKSTHYRNGDAIPNVTDNLEWSGLSTGAWCSYLNDENFVTTYGRLYNWYAVNDGRQIAPAGWHIPTDEEWKQLEMTIGMSREQADATDLRGTDEGGKLKEAGIAHWNFPNNGATNEYGFSALPAGYRYDYGSYSNLGAGTIFWTATALTGTNAWDRVLDYGTEIIYRYDNNKQFGFSVRCVKD